MTDEMITRINAVKALRNALADLKECGMIDRVTVDCITSQYTHELIYTEMFDTDNMNSIETVSIIDTLHQAEDMAYEYEAHLIEEEFGLDIDV